MPQWLFFFFFGRRRSYWCLWHSLSRAKLKEVLPFYLAQFVQKSGVDLYMICQQKRHLLDPVCANEHTARYGKTNRLGAHEKKQVTVKLHVPHLHANGSIYDHAARAVPINSMSNPSRKAYLPAISSFESSMYFCTFMSENTWIVIHDHTAIKGAIYATELRPPTSTRAI